MVLLDKQLQSELDSHMKEGYKLSMENNAPAASKAWLGLWDKIKHTMEVNHIHFIEDFDRAYRGSQSLYNWGPDVERELFNAARTDKAFAQHRIDFCSEFTERAKNKKEHNIIEMKRAAAETYFEIGKAEEGERLFKKLAEAHPTSGWIWIGWSDQYGLFAREETKNNDLAIEILKQGLQVDGLKDKRDVLERLEELYTHQEMKQEAEAIKQEIREMMKSHAPTYNFFSHSSKPVEVAKSTKIGRNDPCPCGSGKKYKKCCG